MARKPGKEVTPPITFDDVANKGENTVEVETVEISSNAKEENIITSNDHVINHSKFNEMDPLEKLRQESPARSLTTRQHGLYFDLDVSDALNAATKGLAKGGKSKLVNDVLREYFVKKGFIR